MTTFSEINDHTGFANGDKFTSAEQVREYFTVENMRAMFPGDPFWDQETYDKWAELVITNRWHMLLTNGERTFCSECGNAAKHAIITRGDKSYIECASCGFLTPAR